MQKLCFVLVTAFLGSCTPLAKVIFRIREPKLETKANAIDYARKWVTDDAILLANKGFWQFKEPLVFTTDSTAGGSKPKMNLPATLVLDGAGNSAYVTTTNKCGPGAPATLQAAIEYVTHPQVDAVKANADFATISQYFSDADGKKPDFSSISNGSQLYVAVIGAKWLGRLNDRYISEVNDYLREHKNVKVKLIFLSCDMVEPVK